MNRSRKRTNPPWIALPSLFCMTSLVYILSDASTVEKANLLQSTQGCTFKQGKNSQQTIILGYLVQGGSQANHGAILIKEGKIARIGTETDVRREATNPTIFDCAQSYVSPGLINPHEHLSGSGSFPDPNRSNVYQHRDQWRYGSGNYTKIEVNYTGAGEHRFWRELRHVLAGTTTIGTSVYSQYLAKNVHYNVAEKSGYKADMEVFPYGGENDNTTAELKNFGYPYKEEMGQLPTPKLSTDAGATMPFVPHIAEGTNSTAKLEGHFFLEYVESQQKAAKAAKKEPRRFSLIHGVGLDIDSIKRLKGLNVTLVWSPRSNVVLYKATAKIPKVLDHGGRVAIGTDFSASGSYNMLEELRCARDVSKSLWDGKLTEEELWKMATEEAAYALGLDEITGRLKQDFAADIMIYRKESENPYSDLLSATVDDVIATFIDGDLTSGHLPSFQGKKVPNHCGYEIEKHFLCVRGGIPYSIEKLEEENAGDVPLIGLDQQADCRT